MSLDLLACKIVTPLEANDVVWVHNAQFSSDDNHVLEVFQRSGVLPIVAARVGRNCLNEKWHDMHQKAVSSRFDTKEEWKEADRRVNEIKTILPNQIHEKLTPYIDVSGDGSWINDEEYLEGYDFLLISW